MHIAMPAAAATDFNSSGAAGGYTSYVIASMPSPAQNPHNATWLSTSTSTSTSPNHHHHHHIHIPTPHPLVATTSFLDKHVPLFAKHHTEFSVNHDARAAKREARRSRIDSTIPEVDVEHLLPPPPPASRSVVAAATATGAGPVLADSCGADNAAWRDVLCKRDAARRRAGSDDLQNLAVHDAIAEEGSDSDSRDYKGSPAVTP